MLLFGLPIPGNVTANAVLSASDAQSIDLKIDDGKPGTGSVVTMTNTMQPSCASSDTATTATYATSASASRVCTMLFITGF